MDEKKHLSDSEDVPSDFFDDFQKDEFIQGLSVIDSWDDEESGQPVARSRINAEAIDGVKDLRELIDIKEGPSNSNMAEDWVEEKRAERREGAGDPRRRNSDRRRSDSASRLDSYIQPGSRRDPNKTNEAIKKDKEVKVKEYLAKHLESSDDIRPPGTELDDYYDDPLMTEKTKIDKNEEKTRSSDRRVVETHHNPSRRSPRRFQHHERRSPHQGPRWSPHRSPRWSPHQHSPPRRSPRRRSPQRRSPQRRSPYRRFTNRYSPQRPHQRFKKFYRSNPRRHSPYQERERRTKSPGRHHNTEHSPVRSKQKDDFLYPKDYPQPQTDYAPDFSNMPYRQYTGSEQISYPAAAPEYVYNQPQVYPGYAMAYGNQQGSSNMAPVPQPVPAPNLVPDIGVHLNTIPAPAMVPAPHQMTSAVQPSSQLSQVLKDTIPNDPLAQLVADGKLSHEDYLKLAPNKGLSRYLDSDVKSLVLKRCSQALRALGKQSLPARLLVDNNFIGAEQKSLTPKFCSPLKRQVTVEFHFTKLNSPTAAQQNKQVVDNIIAAIGLEKIVERPKKRVRKNTKDVAVQTTKPSCDECEIRNATKCREFGTGTDPAHFTATVHTQVDEQDLFSSKAVFNPTGAAAATSHMSIAHLTPAQLVSQLAARAKTLQQPAQASHQPTRHSPYSRGSGRHYQDKYSNYRY